MANCDKSGREYLKLSEAKEGQVVELDSSFPCCDPGLVSLRSSHVIDELWFQCKDGRHYISGQDDGDGYCTGIYPVRDVAEVADVAVTFDVSVVNMGDGQEHHVDAQFRSEAELKEWLGNYPGWSSVVVALLPGSPETNS